MVAPIMDAVANGPGIIIAEHRPVIEPRAIVIVCVRSDGDERNKRPRRHLPC